MINFIKDSFMFVFTLPMLYIEYLKAKRTYRKLFPKGSEGIIYDGDMEEFDNFEDLMIRLQELSQNPEEEDDNDNGKLH